MTTYEKPLPGPTADSQPFWDYCKQHELRMQKCAQCGHIRYPCGFICPKCQSIETEWVRLSGRGKVYSFIVQHYMYDKSFEKDMPYVCASVELEEGPRMLTNIIGCKPDAVKVDMPVEVQFEDITDEFALPKFKPRA